MKRVAVVGSGPGAMYTVKYLLRHGSAQLGRIDIYEKLDTPFGLVRFGVAPDHVEVKEVATEFKSLLTEHSDRLKLYLRADVSTPESIRALNMSYDGLLVATGAQDALRLPLSPLPKYTFSARDFVLWYNGHPDLHGLLLPPSPRNVSIIGQGNVALDAARILSKSVDELLPLRKDSLLSETAFQWLAERQSVDGPLSVSVLGRRGYLHAAFTNKEFRELTTMKDATCKIDPSELEGDMDELRLKSATDRAKSRGLSIVAKCIEANSDMSKKNSIYLRFFTAPAAYIGDPLNGISLSGSGENIPCDMSLESIGFKVIGDELGLPIDATTKGIANDGLGRVIGMKGVYVAGWAKRGPRGVIAANIPCCIETADAILSDLSKGVHNPSQEPSKPIGAPFIA